MTLIYVLLVAHFVGDFLCQSDWMALNKSKRWDALATHVFTYACVLNVAVQVGSWRFWWTDAMAAFVLVNSAAHFVQDAITSRINARLWFIDGVRVKNGMWSRPIVESKGADAYEVAFNDKRHWFFVGIGADQLLHYVTLFITAGWWLR